MLGELSSHRIYFIFYSCAWIEGCRYLNNIRLQIGTIWKRLYKQCRPSNWLYTTVRQEDGSYHITISKQQSKIIILIICVMIILSMAACIWGVVRETEVWQLREKNQMQGDQLKLLDQKIQMLDKKMNVLDSLDQEIRQMIKGSESGHVPQGGPDHDQVPLSTSDETAADGDQSSITAMSIKLSKLDRQAQKRLVSFYMLRSILKDSASDSIKNLKNLNIATNGSSTSNSAMPSIWPSKGVITSFFGNRVDPVYGGSGFHEGVDIADDYNSPIVATADGVVTIASSTDGGYGNLVEINHGNGFITRYGHNSMLLVSPGAKVTQGQVIALMGSTGKSTGPHVHYEVRINGSPVDPMLFLPISNH